MKTSLSKNWRSITAFIIMQLFLFACEQKEKLVYVEVEKEVIKEVEVEKAGSETTTVDPTATTETAATTAATTTTTTTPGTNQALTLASTDVTLQGDFTIGSLAINLDDNNRSFKVYKKKKSNLRVRTADAYKLFCTTFEDTPKACSITLTEDGAYEGICEKFAGTSFGCFLRNGEETLTTLEFGSDTSLVSGAGKIKSAIVYDPDKKSAQAVIDETESTALAPENIADALKANNAVTTEIGNITGGWKLTCVENTASGMTCTTASTTTTTADPYGGAGGYNSPGMNDTAGMGGASATENKKELPDSLFLSVFDQGKRVALWESKNRHDICIASTKDSDGYFKEHDPGFGLKFDNVLYPYRFDNRDMLYASIDKAVFNLYNSGADGVEVINNIIKQTESRNSWVLDQCKPANNPYADSTKCKLALEKTETSSYTDYYTKEVVSYSWTTWPTADDFDAVGFAYTGTITSQSTDCTFDITDGSGKPFCPAHADSMGTYTTYYGKDASNNDARLMLACKLSYSYGSSTSTYTYSWVNQVPAPNSTLADAVNFMNTNQGCDDYTYDKPGAHPFNGKKQKMVKEYRRTMLDLANTSNYYSDLDNLCRDVSVDEGTWNFAQCQDLENSYNMGGTSGGMPQMPPGLMLCWQKWNFNYLGLIEDRDESFNWVSGRYKSDTDEVIKNRTVDWDRWFLGENCADDLTTFDTVVNALNVTDINYATDYDNAKLALYHACQKTTGAIDNSDVPSLAGQIAFARKTALKWDIPAKSLICSSSSQSLTNKVLASAQNSCMPDVYLMPFCDMNGNCMEALRCPGSSSGGKCFKDGEFVGQIPGRLGLMSLKPRVNDAFEMTQISMDSWNMWNNTSQKMETCEMTSTTILNARKKSATEFDTIFKVTQNEACAEPDNSAGTVRAEMGGGGNTATSMSKQSLGNILKKFNFKKCTQDDCSGE